MVTINDTNMFISKPSTTEPASIGGTGKTVTGPNGTPADNTATATATTTNAISNTLDITSSFSDPESGNGDDGSSSSSSSNNNSQNIQDDDHKDIDIDMDQQQEYIQTHSDNPLLDFVEEIPLLITDHDTFSDEDSLSIRSSIDNHFRQEEEHQKQQQQRLQFQLHHARLHRPTTLCQEISSQANTINGDIRTPREGTPATSIPSSSPAPKQEQTEDEGGKLLNQDDVDETIVRKPPIILTEQIRESIIASKIIEKKKQEQIKKQQQSIKQPEQANQTKLYTKDGLSFDQFKQERNQLMSIIIKYIATKIHNSFPPEKPKMLNNGQLELSLDKFLLLLTSRLRLNLTMFMKGIIYLFRYMDIIYLLRYLNQTNNFVNYNDMGFELKKLIIGCFKLAILREKKISSKSKNEQISINNQNNPTKDDDQYNFNWSHITGLPNSEINQIVKTIMNRMNGKLIIKDIELIRLKSEIFRFVKMVATEV